ncbi:MAG: SH3 domain-containing protein [Anaerolineae bacterium]
MPIPSRRTSTLLVMALATLVLASACSLFLPEETPRPEPTTTRTATPIPTNTPRPTVPPPTATLEPTATFTPVPTPTPVVLAVGGHAKVVLPEGRLNVRVDPGTAAELVGRLAPGVVVTILDGPARRNDLVWWKVDDGQGVVGWVAEGEGGSLWLEPMMLEPTPPPPALAVGSRAEVTTRGGARLSLRREPGTAGELVARLLPGTEVVIVDGPVERDGYVWWKVDAGEGRVGWAAQGDPTDQWLTPIP